MQTKHLLAKRYHTFKIDETHYSQTALNRKETLDLYEKLRGAETPKILIFQALKYSQASLYRWRKMYKQFGMSGLEKQSCRPDNLRRASWDNADLALVKQLRRRHPTYGKARLSAILRRDHGRKWSASTVGRMLKILLARNQVLPVIAVTGGRYPRKPRRFSGHAQRLPAGAKAIQPGQLIQIDHTSVQLVSGKIVKHFHAIDPITKISFSSLFHRATATSAVQFLNFLKDYFPFSITSVQVDGGSEFRAEFEKLCEKLEIKLYVLPPRSPKINGCVERSNLTVKNEFYSQRQGPDNLTAIRTDLNLWINQYNTFRPHQSLQYLTPMEYYRRWEAKNSQRY